MTTEMDSEGLIKKFFELEDADGTIKDVELTEKQIEKLRKTLLKLNADITNKTPSVAFVKIGSIHQPCRFP